MGLLYRYQKVAQDERYDQCSYGRFAFVQTSCELLKCEMETTNTSKNLYDFVAKIYMKFFSAHPCKEKAVKLKLIYENEMHRN
jgi:hypothetical protein